MSYSDMQKLPTAPSDLTTSGQVSSSEDVSHGQELPDTISTKESTTTTKSEQTERSAPSWSGGEKKVGAFSTMGQRAMTAIGSPIRWAIAQCSEKSSEPKLSSAEKKQQQIENKMEELRPQIASLQEEIGSYQKVINKLLNLDKSIETVSYNQQKCRDELEELEGKMNKCQRDLQALSGQTNSATYKTTTHTLTLPFLKPIKW